VAGYIIERHIVPDTKSFYGGDDRGYIDYP
jgi:hypothetical protein